jgi:hypothetical protein
MIAVGFYRPDLAATNSGVSGAVLNAIIRRDGLGVAYGPHPSLAPLATSDALPAAPKGFGSVVTRNGNYQVYFGTATKLYKLAADGTYTEIGSGYAVPAGDNWSITQFGDYVYFTNTFDGLLRYNIESGGTVDAVVGAPKGRYIFPLFGTMAMLDCDGENRVMKTSKIEDPTVWSGDASNTNQEFIDGEELIAGGELSSGIAVVFQRNAVRVLTRTRDRSIFTADQLAAQIGAQGAAGVVIVQGWAYFVDTDGFQRTNGGTIEPIGKDKVSQTFVAGLASGGLTTVQGAYDPTRNRVIYRYQKSDVVSTTVFEDALTYDIGTGEWVPVEMSTAAIVTISSPGYTLEELDQFGTIDTLPYSLDDRVWKGGEPRLAAIDGDLKLGFISGAAMACTLECGEQVSKVSLRITGIVPDTDAGAATVQLGVKQAINDDFTWGDAVTLDDEGFGPVDEAGKMYAFRLNIPAGATWDFMRGFDGMEASARGPR